MADAKGIWPIRDGEKGDQVMRLTINHVDDDCYCVGLFGPSEQVQDAYLELDLESGTLSADYSGLQNGMTPGRVQRGVDRWFYFDPALAKDDINALMDAVADLCQTILDGARIEPDLYDRDFVGVLDDEAEVAAERVKEIAGTWDGYMVDEDEEDEDDNGGNEDKIMAVVLVAQTIEDIWVQIYQNDELVWSRSYLSNGAASAEHYRYIMSEAIPMDCQNCENWEDYEAADRDDKGCPVDAANEYPEDVYVLANYDPQTDYKWCQHPLTSVPFTLSAHGRVAMDFIEAMGWTNK